MVIHDDVKPKPDSAIDFHEKSTGTKTSLIKNIPRLDGFKSESETDIATKNSVKNKKI